MKIAHISDLHFGCTSQPVTDALLRHLANDAPDLVIASGDITQSATVAEFEEARTFFKRLTVPYFVIPGNHDLPGMDLTRFVNPFGRYKHHIAEDMEPSLRLACVDIKGINSARVIMPHWNWANGGVSPHQRHEIERFFAASTSSWRMLVLHHPLISAKELPLDVKVYGRTKALETIAEQRIDIVLAGHQHHALVEPLSVADHTTLFVNASTTLSGRIRRQPNGFNLLTFNDNSVRIDLLRFGGERFDIFSAVTHTKTARSV